MNSFVSLSFGQVFAGKAAPIDLLPIESWREVRPLKGVHPYDRIAATPISGNSLYDAGIFNGDFAIFIFTHLANEGDLVIANTPSGQTIKYLYPQDDGTVILRGANSVYEDQQWPEEDVRIQGVVKRIERDL